MSRHGSRQPPLPIAKPILQTFGQTSRVEAVVEDIPVWFESDDAVLDPCPEAFASAFLIPGLNKYRPLKLDTPLDPFWLDNCQKLLKLLNAWWSYPPLQPIAQRGQVSTSPQQAMALCFTGGVDSFHSLLRGNEPPNYVLFVHGYDIPLADTVRMAAVRASLAEVAAARAVNLLIIRTNLRDHPSFRGTDWEHAHGGALAAAGHLLSSVIGRLVVPASYTYSNFHPWGTSWNIDPLWSSSRFQMVHGDASLWRADKLKAIVHEPLVRRHLRVCWENRRPTGNCGICEKCIRTMIALELVGELANFPAFDLGEPLPKLIDQARPISRPLLSVYEGFLQRDISPELRTAIHRWLGRSRPKPDRLWRFKAVYRWLNGRLREVRSGLADVTKKFLSWSKRSWR